MKRKIFVVFAVLLAMIFVPAAAPSGDLLVIQEASATYNTEYSDLPAISEEMIINRLNTADQKSSSETKTEKKKFNPVRSLIIAFVISMLIALIVVLCIKSSLKTVRQKHEASNYVDMDSLSLREKTDTYMYSKTEKTERSDS